MEEFGTSSVDGKLPMDLGSKGVTSDKPRLNGLTEKVARSKTLAETLAFEHTELNFSHVEPTAVNRGVMENETIHQAFGFLGWEGVVESSGSVDIEIIDDQMDGGGMRIKLIQHLTHKERPILEFAMLMHLNVTPTA